jgi:inorganic pyrophosphatase/exopolyphosphatase
MQTEILENGSTLLSTGADEELILHAFGKTENLKSQHGPFLKGIMSRKKQLVPALSAHLS